ncbi:MAG: enoyl-CoA hydratase/isomerase family protein [Deltaproteobacteria bacterium]|nr:enoyl-CoA hydratase/isomerase family protein [Candidatus Zymogenaceae bacterium]
MNYRYVISETRGPVGWLIFNRPELLNALCTKMAEEAISVLTSHLEDDTVKVIVITGEGKAFTAGADVLEVSGDPNPRKRIEILATIAHRAIAEIRQSPKPVIAAVNRQAAGYGAALALACDIRVATQRVKLRYAYSSIGLTGDGGINFSLPRMVGLSRALEAALLADDLTEDDLVRAGLVTRFFPEETFREETQKAAEQVARIPVSVSGAIKRMMYGSFGTDLLVHLATEHAHLAEAASRPEFMEMLSHLLSSFQAKTT